MFDTLFYGYGLTLAILGNISKNIDSSSVPYKYLNFNIFLSDFLSSPDHKRICRQFLECFNMNSQIKKLHADTKLSLTNTLPEIINLGFERWVSKYLFDNENSIRKTDQTYLYILYNYWYHLIDSQILQNPLVQTKLINIGDKIIASLNKNHSVFTTNFDNCLDHILKPDHLHGKFVLPLHSAKDVILFERPDGGIEYKYLFGTSGIEKFDRIQYIQPIIQNAYHLEFFENDKRDLGSVLIYGISFGKAEFVSQAFLDKHPKYKNHNSLKSVDGHIIDRLNELFKIGKIKHLTIAYYSESDLNNYTELFSCTDLYEIVTFRSTDEIFPFFNK